MRYDRASALVHRGFWLLAGLGVAAYLVPAAKTVALSFLIGLLMGLLNVRMLASSLRRGVRMRTGAASSALSMAGILRLVLVVGVMAWLFTTRPVVKPWPLIGGFFVPEVIFVAALLLLKVPFDPAPGHEGDVARDF